MKARIPPLSLYALAFGLLALAPLPTVAQNVNDGFDPDANGPVRDIAVQSDGRILIVGAFTTVGGRPRNGIARLEADGSLDATFDPGIGPARRVTLQADGRILVSVASGIRRVNAHGTLDAGFNVTANDAVTCLALQADERIVVAGYFTTLAGQPRVGMARLESNGNADPSFMPNAGRVECLAVQTDGKILTGGADISRFNPDGTVDTEFVSPNPNQPVRDLVVQPDGKIVVGGWFSVLGNTTRHVVARLQADGRLDSTFSDLGFGSSVDSLALQPDGKILVGSRGGLWNGASHVARLQPDGHQDLTFRPGISHTSDGPCLAVQSDGKILVGGDFTEVCSQVRHRIARLLPDGTLDTALSTAANGQVGGVAVQPDGMILLGGSFTTLGGAPRTNLARIGPDSAVDPTFTPGADNQVFNLALQSSGSILVGGMFTKLAG
ncbi:MAG TPA: hypothetical protein PKM73_20125 [Verrucomicrobiota bacterium]|nr:hypothetical protein [Verrucomicrobiota bacterium]HNU51506.1 hypothetical protein [Verrucomicrobiota bacterium]